MTDAVERYLSRLRRDLGRRGLRAPALVDEARDHLGEAIAAAERRGFGRDEAVREALDRFGPADVVAERYAREASRTLSQVLLALAIPLGLGIAWVDSRPTWDDTGVTAFAMLIAAAGLGLVGPRRPWRWALAIGVWIPLHLMVASPTAKTLLAAPLILLFPLAGAYAGMAVRRVVAAR